MLSRDCPDCCISGHDCLPSLRGMQGDARLCRLFSVLDFEPGILLLYLLPFLVAFLSMWFFTMYTCAVTMDLGEAAASRPACSCACVRMPLLIVLAPRMCAAVTLLRRARPRSDKVCERMQGCTRTRGRRRSTRRQRRGAMGKQASAANPRALGYSALHREGLPAPGLCFNQSCSDDPP